MEESRSKVEQLSKDEIKESLLKLLEQRLEPAWSKFLKGLKEDAFSDEEMKKILIFFTRGIERVNRREREDELERKITLDYMRAFTLLKSKIKELSRCNTIEELADVTNSLCSDLTVNSIKVTKNFQNDKVKIDDIDSTNHIKLNINNEQIAIVFMDEVKEIVLYSYVETLGWIPRSR